MAGSKSNYLSKKLLDQVFGATAYTAPATLYVALHTVTPSDTGGGTEATGTGYARVAVTNNTTNWPAATGTTTGTKSNGTIIDFGTAGASWGTIVGFGIYDASSAGNLLAWGDLTTSKAVTNGDPVSFPVSSLTFTED